MERKGGGVIIAIRKHIKVKVIPTDSILEIVWIACYLAALTLVTGACYRPPDVLENFFEELQSVLGSVQFTYKNSSVILAGDFNFPGIEWSTLTTPGTRHTRECADFIDLLEYFQLSQIIQTPTRGDAILDLFLTTHPERVTVDVLEHISDHRIIHCTFITQTVKKLRQRKEIYDYSRADAEGFNFELFEFCLSFLETYETCSLTVSHELNSS